MLRVVGKAIKSEDSGAKIVTAGLPDSKLKSAMPLGSRACARLEVDRRPRSTSSRRRADMADRIGAEHVALASDFDGAPSRTLWATAPVFR